MAIVTSTDKSKFLNQRSHEVHALKGKEDKPSDRGGDQNVLLQNGDNIDFSPAAKMLLKTTGEKFDSLVEEYPEYSHHLQKQQDKDEKDILLRSMNYLSQGKVFLEDSFNQRLIQDNSNFSTFYSQVAELIDTHRQAMQKVQNALRVAEMTTYHKLVNPNNINRAYS